MKTKVSNFYLALNWAEHGDMPDYVSQLEEWIEMDDEQALFAAGLPMSAKEFMAGARESVAETVAGISKAYKAAFVEDAPGAVRKKMIKDLEQEKIKLGMIDRFIFKLEWGNRAWSK